MSVTERRKELYETILKEPYDDAKAEEIRNLANNVEALIEGDPSKIENLGQIYVNMRDYVMWLINTTGFKDMWNRSYEATAIGVVRKNYTLRTGRHVALLSHHQTSGVLVEGSDINPLRENTAYVVHGRIKPRLGPATWHMALPHHYELVSIEAKSKDDINVVDRFVIPVSSFTSVNWDSEPASAGELVATSTTPQPVLHLKNMPDVLGYIMSDYYNNPSLNPLYKTYIMHVEEIDLSKDVRDILIQICNFVKEDVGELDVDVKVYLEKAYTDEWRTNFASQLSQYLYPNVNVEIYECDDPIGDIEYSEYTDRDVIVYAGSPDPDYLYRLVHLLDGDTFSKYYIVSMIAYMNLSTVSLARFAVITKEEPQIVKEIRSPVRYLLDSGIVLVETGWSKDDLEVFARILGAKLLGYIYYFYHTEPLHRNPRIPYHLEVLLS